MSEDTLRLEAKSKPFPKSKKLEFENIISKYIPSDCKTLEIKYSGQKATYFLERFSLGEEDIDQLIMEFEQSGANDIIVTVWYDNIGEELVYSRIVGKLSVFSSEEELKSHIKDMSSTKLTSGFNYGKTWNSKTLLVRLDVKAKSKREKIANCFRGLVSNVGKNTLEDFYKQFALLPSTDIYETRWCAMKKKDENDWSEGPFNLAEGARFVLDDAQSLYIGFDIDGLDLFEPFYYWDTGIEEFDIDEFDEEDFDEPVVKAQELTDDDEAKLNTLLFIFCNLDGVKKTWIKVRPDVDTSREFYVYWPDICDVPVVRTIDIVDNMDWPR